MSICSSVTVRRVDWNSWQQTSGSEELKIGDQSWFVRSCRNLLSCRNLSVSPLMFSASNRHPDLTVRLCASNLRFSRPPLLTLPNSIHIFSLLPCLNSLPVAFICCSRKALAIHRRPTELDFKAVSLLLLAGDVALNPGPTSRLENWLN